MDLRKFDLNLLVILQTLIAERSVSRTVQKLHLSQPATSAALKRLQSAPGIRVEVWEIGRDAVAALTDKPAIQWL